MIGRFLPLRKGRAQKDGQIRRRCAKRQVVRLGGVSARKRTKRPTHAGVEASRRKRSQAGERDSQGRRLTINVPGSADGSAHDEMRSARKIGRTGPPTGLPRNSISVNQPHLTPPGNPGEPAPPTRERWASGRGKNPRGNSGRVPFGHRPNGRAGSPTVSDAAAWQAPGGLP